MPERTTPNNPAVSGVPIELVGLSKVYPGTNEPAVDDVSMTIPAGEIVVLVGPSGCGKTTTMKMINRLVEPSAGRILLDGESVMSRNPDELRRNIGYVIQAGGLFPHMTVGTNVATVPRLLGWTKERIRSRVRELLDLVGLDPAHYEDRYPRELSGGQQQRVGVARALAADPPVLLMDEPFGAVDPITRGRLQDELLRLQEELHKTIVFVTHDFDEAIKLGNRIAVLDQGSRIVQYDTPSEILANPAESSVAGFVGADAALKRLSLERIGATPLDEAVTVSLGGSDADASDAAHRVRETGRKHALVLDGQERPVVWISLDELDRGAGGLAEFEPGRLDVIGAQATLNNALDLMLTSSHGVVVVTDPQERYQGVVRVETLMAATQQMRADTGRAGGRDE